jgi:hypothetical protein
MPVRARVQGAVWPLAALLFVLLVALPLARPAVAQEPGPTPSRDRYILGQEKNLEMVVHILGQVQRPGEYQVPDGTNALELISKAGGPTEFASLGGVWITHAALGTTPGSVTAAGPRIVPLNLEAYLASPNPGPLLALQPGDVVNVPSNGKSTWKFVAGILRDLSVVATAYFLGVRAFK